MLGQNVCRLCTIKVTNSGSVYADLQITKSTLLLAFKIHWVHIIFTYRKPYLSGEKNGMKIVNRSFEGVETFKYLGTTLTDQNCMHEDIKSRLDSGNACYHSF
jgi:hypothetical protein